MDKFTNTYLDIINEAKLKNKKWKRRTTFNDIEVFENQPHLKERLFKRYGIDEEKWIYWFIIKTQIIKYLIKDNAWLKCSKKTSYQKGFTVHLTISNMWLSGILQNDIEDGGQRIYFSTFLPEDPHFNLHDIYFNLPL